MTRLAPPTPDGTDQAIPKAALALTALGLAPLPLAGLAVLFLNDRVALFALVRQIDYAALNLAFVGAVHWGLAMARGRAEGGPSAGWLAASMVPALVAWVSLLLAPAPALILLMLATAGAYGLDRRAAQDGLAPGWYLRLRLPGTAVTVVALGLSLARVAWEIA